MGDGESRNDPGLHRRERGQWGTGEKEASQVCFLEQMTAVGIGGTLVPNPTEQPWETGQTISVLSQPRNEGTGDLPTDTVSQRSGLHPGDMNSWHSVCILLSQIPWPEVSLERVSGASRWNIQGWYVVMRHEQICNKWFPCTVRYLSRTFNFGTK